MTRVFIWKNNCPQEWEEISFTAFRKARSSGAFSGRFFIETTRMIYDDSDRLIIECSQEQFEKYRHEERHSRYLQEHEGRYLTIPMSDLKDRDQSDEGYEDTDIFVNEEPGTEDMALHNLQLKKLQAALNQLEPSEREFILAYDLVKRAHLETMIIDRRIRVVNDSFESWYAGQSHYIKITERSC